MTPDLASTGPYVVTVDRKGRRMMWFHTRGCLTVNHRLLLTPLNGASTRSLRARRFDKIMCLPALEDRNG